MIKINFDFKPEDFPLGKNTPINTKLLHLYFIASLSKTYETTNLDPEIVKDWSEFFDFVDPNVLSYDLWSDIKKSWTLDFSLLRIYPSNYIVFYKFKSQFLFKPKLIYYD